MRKPTFCIWENKGADQLRGNRALISAFVFPTCIVQSLFFLNPKFQARFVWDQVGNPEDRFSHKEAHMISTLIIRCLCDAVGKLLVL